MLESNAKLTRKDQKIGYTSFQYKSDARATECETEMRRIQDNKWKICEAKQKFDVYSARAARNATNEIFKVPLQ